MSAVCEFKDWQNWIKNPVRKLFGFHVHNWEHLETHRIPTTYEKTRYFLITNNGRRFYYRHCEGCEKTEQYYPVTPPSSKDDIRYGDDEVCPWAE